ncbi:hypothetical protein HQ533_04195 [Candidatus Woesearchaeota archaeon]|nr:hypothetical protein [Candidatus Woesearchaeota archaeon]
MNFLEIEDSIKFLARRYADPYMIEDFEQIGRITAWQLLETDSTFSKSYILTAVKHDMIDQLRFLNAEKRKPEKGFISLDAPINHEGGRTYHDVIGGRNEFFPDVEATETILDTLKNKYGHYYIYKLKKTEAKPILIVRRIIRTAIEDVAQIKFEEIPSKVDWNFFKSMKLGKLLWVFYRNSPARAVMDTYPGEFVPWNFKRAGRKYWTGKRGYNNAVMAVSWFAKKKNIQTIDDCVDIRAEDFKKEGLGSMLKNVFNSSPYSALKVLFPEFKAWKLNITPRGYFDNHDNKLNAVVDYLITNNIGNISNMTSEEVFDTRLKSDATTRSLKEAGLRGLMSRYSNSNYRMFKDLFPEQILPWSINGAKEPWKKDPEKTSADAIQWLFENYLNMSTEDIPRHATYNLFLNVGFTGIVINRFNNSIYKTVDNAYPGMFSQSDFKRRNYSNGKL